MEGASKMVKMVMVMVVIMLVLEVQTGESVIGILMNPCYEDRCVKACKNILGSKYMSASCATNASGQICYCFG